MSLRKDRFPEKSIFLVASEREEKKQIELLQVQRGNGSWYESWLKDLSCTLTPGLICVSQSRAQTQKTAALVVVCL